MIKALIFDCFGVLTVGTWHAFLDSLPEGINMQQVRDLNRAFDSGLIGHREFFEGVQELTGQSPPDIEQLSGSAAVKNSGLIDYIRQLKPAYKIGLLSNISSDWITRELLTTEEGELFDDMVFSYQVGMAKPDPRIYELACERLGLEPAQVIMVDDIPNNIAAAQSVGMQGLVYQDLPSFTKQLNELLNPNN